MYFVCVAVWVSLVHLLPSDAIILDRYATRRTRAIDGYDNNQITGSLSFKPSIPKECEEIGICDDVPEYPQQYVTQLIDQINKVNQTHFNMDIIQLDERFGPEEDNTELCQSKTMLFSPLAARSVNGKKWYYIVNKRNEEAVQTFRVDVCNKQNVMCDNVASFALGNEGYCKQKYILRKMVALDYTGSTYEDYFIIPSCCSCVYRTLSYNLK
ncbi:PREDICTED: protein spaetzle [Papilio polytes]|uniref:protein spaetzle n=1 Tax=Papilio polytes TaxID=76194 RepID=UPI0006760D18|nr:PREDICTED: protein spaetzle [Papilio polytes]